MKKMIKDNLLFICIILNILYVFIGSFLFTSKVTTYGNFGKSMVSVSIINLIICGILFIIKKFIKKDYKVRIYDIFLLLMVIFACISTHYAVVKKVALYGTPYRYEGLYALLYYFSLVFLSSFLKPKQKKLVTRLIISIGIIQAIYGYMQIMDFPFVRKYVYGDVIWAAGTLNNPNFYGAFMLLATGYSIGLFFDKNELLEKIVYLIAFIICFLGILISNTTSCAVGLIMILLFVLVYCIRYKKYKSLLCLLVIVCCETFLLQKLNMTTLVDDLIKTKNETVELSKGNFDGSYGTKRMEVWRRTMEIVPDHLLHGVGIDNYVYAFNRRPLIIQNKIYDKVHNDYLQILITQGIFSLISYLGLFTVVTLKGIKNSFKKKELLFILPVGGYLIQNFFNISVIEVAPFFYIALGLLIDRDDIDDSFYKKFLKRFLDVLLSLILFIILLPLLIIISILIVIIDHVNPIYKQVRTGRNGKNFNIYKFKTINNNEVTKCGKLLRLLSIDELPQLINVIKGDMSLIGPRPWVTDYYDRLNDKQRRRVDVRPGIIGLAQVNGRNNINIFKKIDYDLEYIDNLTFILDLKIFFKCFKSIIVKEESNSIEDGIKKELKMLESFNKKKTNKNK